MTGFDLIAVVHPIPPKVKKQTLSKPSAGALVSFWDD